MHDPGIDPLSPLAKKIVDAGNYRELVVTGDAPAQSHVLLGDVTPDQLLAVPFNEPVAAYAMLGGLWLFHDALNACHEIVQKEPEKLISAALNLHRKGSKAKLNVLSGEYVENGNVRDPKPLREMAETLAFWHVIMHRYAYRYRVSVLPRTRRQHRWKPRRSHDPADRWQLD